MQTDDVLQIYNLLTGSGVTTHIDGGWGVDALVGEQTRQHSDLDIAIPVQDVALARRLLEGEGYHEIPRNDSTADMFVLSDGNGHEIDIHAYNFDADGNNDGGVEYPLGSLNGQGIIGGQAVHCIAPEYVLRFHMAYEPKAKDYHDVKLLCDKFGLRMPKQYERFEA